MNSTCTLGQLMCMLLQQAHNRFLLIAWAHTKQTPQYFSGEPLRLPSWH